MYNLQERFFPYIGDNTERLSGIAEALIDEQIDIGRYDPAHVYTFLMDALGRILEADYFGGIFAEGTTKAVNYHSRELLSFPTEMEVSTEYVYSDTPRPFLDLADWNIACNFEKSQTLSYSMTDFVNAGGQVPDHGRDTVRGLVYPMLHFAVIYNGRHRATAARVNHAKPFMVESEIVDIAPLFHKLRINRRMEWCDAEGNPLSCDLPDPRFALLYDLARRRACLQESPEYFCDHREEICRLLPVNESTEENKKEIELRYGVPQTPPLYRHPQQPIRKKLVVFQSLDELAPIQQTLLHWLGLDLKDGFLIKRTKLIK